LEICSKKKINRLRSQGGEDAILGVNIIIGKRGFPGRFTGQKTDDNPKKEKMQKTRTLLEGMNKVPT